MGITPRGHLAKHSCRKQVVLSGKIRDGQGKGKAAKKNGGFLIRNACSRGHSSTGQSTAAMTGAALSLRTGPCWEDEPSEPYNYFHGFISVHFLKMSFRDTKLASHECCACQHSSKSGKWRGLGCLHPALSSVHMRAAANGLSFSLPEKP